MFSCVVAARAEVAIVDPRINEPIDHQRLVHILLGQVTTWADGSPIILVLASDPASRAAIERLTGRDLDRLLRGWKRLIFAGAGAMPMVVESAPQALIQVGTHLGAIAIVGDAVEVPKEQLRVIRTSP